MVGHAIARRHAIGAGRCARFQWLFARQADGHGHHRRGADGAAGMALARGVGGQNDVARMQLPDRAIAQPYLQRAAQHHQQARAGNP
ncbi:hypothetical protein KXW36_001280, partial [Aspergillus fumigatus]